MDAYKWGTDSPASSDRTSLVDTYFNKEPETTEQSPNQTNFHLPKTSFARKLGIKTAKLGGKLLLV